MLLCLSGRGKAYMEIAWALCVPTLDKLTVFHRCRNHLPTTTTASKTESSGAVAGPGGSGGSGAPYKSGDVAFAKAFFEGPRAKMYPHVGDPSMII
jgi:hypothetical protein